MSRLRRRDQRGASLVEFALVAPVFFGVLGLALFAAHIYEVQSDLQRAAQRTATHGSVKCDYRGTVCPSGYRSEAQLLAYAKEEFNQTEFVVGDPADCTLGDRQAVMCTSFDPNPPAGPRANQRMRVQLLYRYETPLAPFLRLIGAGNALVDLEGRGEATVE